MTSLKCLCLACHTVTSLSLLASCLYFVEVATVSSCVFAAAERVMQEKLNIVCVPTSFQVSGCAFRSAVRVFLCAVHLWKFVFSVK